MASNIITAKNTFSEGLVMDFSPDNTQASVLTSALNATLLTFNGNEMSLQNDMGNGRVETAHLPEGYIPVGTCEFGDIIYIVSYNPLTNKSQIGCFPSPERNISSDELHDNVENQILSDSDFIESITSSDLDTVHRSRRVKANSVRKILMNKKINPGDKFVIFDKSKGSIHKEVHVSDVGNISHEFGKFPKLLKVHIVSISDSGKIDFLDSDVKWYQLADNNLRKDYFIINQVEGNDGTPDIDSYRTSISSGYSVFQSKVSGKLALLVELERIDTFSCTYSIVKDSTDSKEVENAGTVKYQYYQVYLNMSWETSDYNINPSAICLYDQKWTGVNSELGGKALLWYKAGEESYELRDEHAYKVDFPIGSDKRKTKLRSFMQCWNENDFGQKYYTEEISRGYKQESSDILYEDFTKSKSYQKILEKSLDVIRLAQYTEKNKEGENPDTSWSEDVGVEGVEIYPSQLEQYDNVKDIVLTKVNISQFGSSKYYINAYETIIQGENVKYYTSYQNKNIEIRPYQINDDIINNYFKYPITKYFGRFCIPIKQVFKGKDEEMTPDISNLIYNYEVAPMMPYGVLPDLKVSGYINFSKLGSGEISLTQWKYYNVENMSTLTLGLEIFPEENKGVNAVILEFIDNQGVTANYILNNNNSYSGIFTDNIPLNGSFQNYRFSGTDINGNPIYHAGQESENGTIYRSSTDLQKYNSQYNEDEDIWEDFQPEDGDELIWVELSSEQQEEYFAKVRRNGKIIKVKTKEATVHINDAGTIYSNFLYLVKITIQYCPKDAIGNYDTTNQEEFKTFYRWLWTNTMYNDKYYNVLDFDTLLLELNTDVGVSYSTNNNYNLQTKNFTTSKKADLDTPSNNFGTVVQEITGNKNIQVKITPGLQETYNTFSLSPQVASNLKLSIYKGNAYITSEDSTVMSTNGKYEKDSDVLHPERLLPAEGVGDKPAIIPANWDNQSYKELPNWQALDIGSEKQFEGSIEYINYLGESSTVSKPFFGDIDNQYLQDDSFNYQLGYNALNFSNFYQYYASTSEGIPTYVPIVHDMESAKKYGFVMDGTQHSSGTYDLILKNMFHLSGGDKASGRPYPIREIYYTFRSDDKQSSTSTQKEQIHSQRDSSQNIEPIDRSILDRFGNLIKDSQLNYGFCAVRFYDIGINSRRGINAFVLGSTKPDTIFKQYHQKYSQGSSIYDFYFNVFSVAINKSNEDVLKNLWFDSTDSNTSYGVRPIESGLVFPAFIDSNKNLYLINNYIQVTDHLKQPMWNNSFQPTPSTREASDDSTLNEVLKRISVYILDILTQLYVRTDKQESVETVADVIYLKPHVVTYTYDILYDLRINNYDQSSISMQGIVLSDYLKAVKNTQQDCSLINENNVSVIISGSLKNAPISVEFTTKEPPVSSTQSLAVFKEIIDERSIGRESTTKVVQLDDYGSQFYYKSGNQYKAYNWIGAFNIRQLEHTDNDSMYTSDGTSIYYYGTRREDASAAQLSSGFKYDNQLQVIPDENMKGTIVQTYVDISNKQGTQYHLDNLEYISWSNVYKNIKLYNGFNFFET